MMKRRRFIVSLLSGGFAWLTIRANGTKASLEEIHEAVDIDTSLLRQSTRQVRHIGPLLNAHDGVTVEADLSPVTELSKNEAPFVDGPTGVHDHYGLYSIVLTAAHTDTIGRLVVHTHESTVHLPVWRQFFVVPAYRLPGTRDVGSGR